MLYRETGGFKKSYQTDQQLFPITQDRWLFHIFLLFLFFVMPFFMDSYLEKSIFIPFFVYAIAAIGLNILTGYCGQVSLGTGGFMAAGAYTAYKLTTSFPDLNIIFVILLSGLVTAGIGMLFGLPSLRIKGFYLAVATLAAQFFIIWLVNKVPWFYNNSASGQITMPERTLFGYAVTGPYAKPEVTYLFCLGILTILAFAARNIVRGRIGRSWMAIRDMDIAAEIIGVSPMRAKLSAFCLSSFYIGIAGALFFAVFLGAIEPTEAFDITKSFLVLFMIIIGGLGSILGSLLGAGFIMVLPIALKNVFVDGLSMNVATAKHIEIVFLGALIIFFLIVEPHGLARLWAIAKQKLRLWPFPH